jgi:hypothetical protein
MHGHIDADGGERLDQDGALLRRDAECRYVRNAESSSPAPASASEDNRVTASTNRAVASSSK